jgi:carboxyl-terminal processing protease
VKKLKGPKGTKVRVTIVRPGLAEPLNMTVTRAEIPTNSVSHAFMLEPGVGYIRLKDFTATTVPEMLDSLEKLEKQGMKKLVFDLRSNPGGLLDQAIGISDFFLKKGDKVVFTKGRVSSSEQTFFAPGKNSRPRIPLVILVNKGSASASEIVAGAVQDHDRGLIVGQTSWGKGLVQSVFTLSEGAGLAVTSAKYYTPAGRCIQRDYREVIEYMVPSEDDENGEETPIDQKEVFKTQGGRTVYGGGGITPDVQVKNEQLSGFAAGLYARGVFFEYAVDYRARNSEITQEFKVTDAVLKDFFKFVDSRPVPFEKKAEELYTAEKDPSPIQRAIREELVTAVFGREAGYRVTLEGDKQLKTALTLFPQAEKLAGLNTPDKPGTENPTEKALAARK